MYRIAHISDLHLVAKGIKPQHTRLQKIAAMLGEDVGLKVEANPFSELTLHALETAMKELSPNALFITGDLTNYGDDESMTYAAQIIENLRVAAGTDPVTLVVPGNHDTLTERMALVNVDDSLTGRVVRKLRGVSPELDIISRLALAMKDPPVGAPPFLGAYCRCIPSQYRPNFTAPLHIDMRWGKAAVFCFNSNVEATLMANKGAIGPGVYVRLHRVLVDRHNELAECVKIALLHHHPISAPQSIDSDAVRFFNWMEDGPKFLQYLNAQGFSMVFHGHQHEPFVCTVDYLSENKIPLHILAAGSATQAGGPSSFNLIDVLSPFELRIQRFDYRDPLFTPEIRPHRLAIRSVKRIRLTRQDEAERPEDGALRNLMLSSDDSYDSDTEYDLLEYHVRITDTQRYIADYRRVGTVRGRAGQDGTIFVITGSPQMRLADMNLYSRDGRGQPANCVVVSDEDMRKVVRVSPKGQKLAVGDAFDVTLHFEWQANELEPNDFDAFNLMNIRYPVKRFRYVVDYPWHASRISVSEFVLERRDGVFKPAEVKRENPVGTTLTLDIGNPRPIAYLISFSKGLRPWLA